MGLAELFHRLALDCSPIDGGWGGVWLVFKVVKAAREMLGLTIHWVPDCLLGDPGVPGTC